MSAIEEQTVSQETLEAYAEMVMDIKTGELVSLIVYFGDRLGLYEALLAAGPITANQLAERVDLNERWLLEWLRGQASAGLLAYQGEDRFELTSEAGVVLTDETSPMYLAGMFGEPTPPHVVERLAQAFRTGIGMSWDDHGPNVARSVERMTGSVHAKLPNILDKVEGLTSKLNAGVRVSDIGCGSGTALEVLAKAYPNSEFVGYDPSPVAIDRARVKAKQAGLSNITFEIARGESLPAEPTYDLTLTLDCMHDMTYPVEVTRAIRQTIKSDGVWIVKDIKCSDKFEENLENPLGATFYGFSMLYCMSSALSEPGGAGLGTLGFTPNIAKEITEAGGFTQFRQIDFDEDPFNNFYEVRP